MDFRRIPLIFFRLGGKLVDFIVFLCRVWQNDSKWAANNYNLLTAVGYLLAQENQ